MAAVCVGRGARALRRAHHAPRRPRARLTARASAGKAQAWIDAWKAKLCGADVVAFFTPTLPDPAAVEAKRRADEAAAWIAAWKAAAPEAETSPGLDVGAVLRYVGATVAQWGAMVIALALVEKGAAAVAALPKAPSFAAPTMVWLYFAFLALRSRVFSPLDNSRPKVAQEREQINEKKRPSWMPPPIAFPIVWSTIAVLRASAATVLFCATGGKLLITPVCLFLLHLSIGDTWNTINNVEKRLGVAAVGVLFVLASVYTATAAYFTVSPMAAYVLAPSCVWLTVATALVWSIWSLNGKAPLYPTKDA